MKTYDIELAGITIPYVFKHKETLKYFKDYTIGEHDDYVEINESLLKEWLKDNTDSAYGEFCLLPFVTSDYLFNYHRCMIHGAAFIYKGDAYLLCAGSGVGKTTQLKNLLELENINVINGDKPILDRYKLTIHPSYWNGKEGLKGDKSCKLKAIICLSQGDNHMKKLSTKDSVPKIYQSIFSTYTKSDHIHIISMFTTKIVENIPIYEFINDGTIESSRMLLEELKHV